MSPMTKRRFTAAYPAERRERGVRLFREHRADYTSDSAAYRAIAPKLGCSPDRLRAWCHQAERDGGRQVLPEPGSGPLSAYRRDAMVDPKIHEHDTAIRGSNPRSRRRVKIESAKYL